MTNASKKIGLMSMIFLCLNGMVGSGLFLLPGQVASSAGKWGLLVYVAVAAIVISIGWCYVQCANHYSRSGGPYLYAKEAFGNFVGFEVGIMRWVVGMVSWASLTVGFIIALGAIWPQILMSPYREILIISTIAALGIINIFGAGAIKRLNNVITITKVLLLVCFVACGLFFVEKENLQILKEPFPVQTFGSAALIIFFAFSGFEALTIAASEMENPKKNIPLAMITGIIFCSIFYFVVQLICIGVLGDDLAKSASPIADIASVVYGDVGKFVVSIALLISIGGVIIVSSFITPRNCAVLAEDHMLFSRFVQQNRFEAPYVAIIVSSVIVCMVALSGGFLELVTISVVARFVQHTTICLALFSLDKKKVMNPFSSSWKKAIPLFALSGILWLLFHAELYHIAYGLGALCVGALLYHAQHRFAKKLLAEV